MEIIKSSGEHVIFNPNKIRKSLRRAGARPDVVEKVIGAILPTMHDGMTTRQVFRLVRRELRKVSRRVAHRYNLRDALLKLGPAGFKFEKYVASILTAYQYETELPENEMAGLCVNHEIDVIARKNGRTVMIEAKFRNKFGDTVNLKDTMATWAGFLDMVEGSKTGKCPKFDEVWIVTNGRFSERALQFGTCRGMHLVGWGAEEHSLPRLVDHAALYPITVIDDLHQWEMDSFSENNLMLCREIAGQDPAKLAGQVRIDGDRAQKIVNACQEVVAAD